ncbi:periplasmic heavy metal sensor [Chlorobium sp. N1]|uniref:Spy/CpxP family protein refolding chaperone n=1 Tax=Chlorobium sp. N1 TaxID=2491138 RepID=UPI00103CE8EC|nr:periplasmic heavy metal sensor [Chlorobium sp. N1]TCD48873.1 periplasmic heavy metal sensor [Chlorobium sp. N1]
MNFLTTKRLVTTALILLVILNVTLLGVLWWQNTRKPEPGPVRVTREVSRQVFFQLPLSLTSEQARSFQELRREHFRKVWPEMKAIASLKEQLVEESFSQTPDTLKISALATELGRRHALVENALASHFHELAAVCTPAQRDSLKAMLRQLSSRKFVTHQERWRETTEGREP